MIANETKWLALISNFKTKFPLVTRDLTKKLQFIRKVAISSSYSSIEVVSSIITFLRDKFYNEICKKLLDC